MKRKIKTKGSLELGNGYWGNEALVFSKASLATLGPFVSLALDFYSCWGSFLFTSAFVVVRDLLVWSYFLGRFFLNQYL